MRIIFILLIAVSTSWSQEHARILSLHTVYTISNLEDAEISETYRIQINSEKGKRFAVYQEYTDKFRKIADVSIEIQDVQGKKIKKLRKSDGLEIGFNPSYEISDAKTFILVPDYQNYPYVAEVTSKIKLNGYLSLPTWMPRHTFNLAVDQATLDVVRPQAFDPKFKEEFIAGVTTNNHLGTITTSYEVKGLPAIEKKMRYKDFYDAQAKLLLSPKQFKLSDSRGSLSSWSEFGDWFLSLNSEPFQLDQKTIEFIGTTDKSNPQEVIRSLYEYMQDRTRYVSIQLGIGGFKSLPTEDVEKFGYGDCKALTTYMKNMLHEAGIPSNYILVRAGNDVPDVISEFPSNQFNHVFLGIPMKSDTIMLECTSQTSPSNYTGTFTDDRNVLWIEKNKSKIIRGRIYDHEQNVKKSSIRIKLTPEGDADVAWDINNKGVFFDEIMIYQSAPQDYLGEYNNRKFSYDDFAIKNYTYKQPSRNAAAFNNTFNIQVKGLAKLAGDKLILQAVPATPFKKFVDGDDMMKYYSIKRGISVNDEIEVELPKNYWIYSLPEKEEVNSRFGSYSVATTFDGERLKVRRSMVLYKGDYTKKEFEEFRAFFQKVDRLEARKLVLNSKT